MSLSPRAVPVILGLAPLFALVTGTFACFVALPAGHEPLVERLGAGALVMIAAVAITMGIPLRMPQSLQPAVATAIGSATVVASFFTVIAVWFLPSAALLLAASLFAPDRNGKDDAGP